MTYYEEFGVQAGASHDEIRQAYKHLVRLLHPDHCSDEATRRLADLQMKRLNGVLAVLADPVTRDAYDRSLAAIPPPSGNRGWRDPRWLRPAAAIAVALLVLLLCAVLPVRSPPTPVAATPSPGPPPAAPKPTHRTPSRSPLRVVIEEPAPELPSVHVEASATRTESQSADAEPQNHDLAPPSESPVSPAPQTIAGEWFFVASSGNRPSGYPPEYIELRVTDDHGMVRGRYRARYRVADRAISPNVAFQFAGRTSPEGGVLPWRGAGGAQGEITLRLLGNGDLDVEWAADQMGEDLGLISGKARLVRKLD